VKVTSVSDGRHCLIPQLRNSQRQTLNCGI
jgi:hypothetical protein